MCKLKSSEWCVSIACIACSSPLPLLWELHYSACCPTFSCATFSIPPSLFHWLMSVALVAEYPWGKTTAIGLHQIRSSWRLRRHWPVCVYILLLSIPLMPLPSMFGLLYPNFKRPIHSQKCILKQQVRVPLSIPKHSTKITCQCTNPFRHLVRATPKTTRKPFRGHGRHFWPRSPWPPQRSAARPRRHGLPQPHNAAASGLGRRGCDADGGRLRLPSRNKA